MDWARRHPGNQAPANSLRSSAGLLGRLEFSCGEVAAKRSAKQLLFEIANDLANVRVHFHAVLDQAAGMKNGAVVAPAEGLADGIKRALRHLTRKKHRDLARERNVLRPAFAGHVREANIKMLGDAFLDDF